MAGERCFTAITVSGASRMRYGDDKAVLDAIERLTRHLTPGSYRMRQLAPTAGDGVTFQIGLHGEWRVWQ